ncbi:transmembrane protein, putative (macronuclear) [Tetrahymena thermophila SB210]|uniref:Transmembrane protein, putative n=1 Tax=Tetrahymena thermophila (strain SB210) TaxID=312017 RepID=W7X5M5_TETTS|nr:transmembrane protein, putative [Tetrahymena thermophila SB210]EWS72697.1 transmembrane protein, putative [Tetrahymena thermophila SB210]|eukprot:XP_012654773.1 transmembrane protein, putative [Tetrahymena thermophila SB210]
MLFVILYKVIKVFGYMLIIVQFYNGSMYNWYSNNIFSILYRINFILMQIFLCNYFFSQIFHSKEENRSQQKFAIRTIEFSLISIVFAVLSVQHLGIDNLNLGALAFFFIRAGSS